MESLDLTELTSPQPIAPLLPHFTLPPLVAEHTVCTKAKLKKRYLHFPSSILSKQPRWSKVLNLSSVSHGRHNSAGNGFLGCVFVSSARQSSGPRSRSCPSWRCTSGTVGEIHLPPRNQSRSSLAQTKRRCSAILTTSVSRDCFKKTTWRSRGSSIKRIRGHSASPLKDVVSKVGSVDFPGSSGGFLQPSVDGFCSAVLLPAERQFIYMNMRQRA